MSLNNKLYHIIKKKNLVKRSKRTINKIIKPKIKNNFNEILHFIILATKINILYIYYYCLHNIKYFLLFL